MSVSKQYIRYPKVLDSLFKNTFWIWVLEKRFDVKVTLQATGLLLILGSECADCSKTLNAVIEITNSFTKLYGAYYIPPPMDKSTLKFISKCPESIRKSLYEMRSLPMEVINIMLPIFKKVYESLEDLTEISPASKSDMSPTNSKNSSQDQSKSSESDINVEEIVLDCSVPDKPCQHQEPSESKKKCPYVTHNKNNSPKHESSDRICNVEVYDPNVNLESDPNSNAADKSIVIVDEILPESRDDSDMEFSEPELMSGPRVPNNVNYLSKPEVKYSLDVLGVVNFSEPKSMSSPHAPINISNITAEQLKHCLNLHKSISNLFEPEPKSCPHKLDNIKKLSKPGIGVKCGLHLPANMRPELKKLKNCNGNYEGISESNGSFNNDGLISIVDRIPLENNRLTDESSSPRPLKPEIKELLVPKKTEEDINVITISDEEMEIPVDKVKKRKREPSITILGNCVPLGFGNSVPQANEQGIHNEILQMVGFDRASETQTTKSHVCHVCHKKSKKSKKSKCSPDGYPQAHGNAGISVPFLQPRQMNLNQGPVNMIHHSHCSSRNGPHRLEQAISNEQTNGNLPSSEVQMVPKLRLRRPIVIDGNNVGHDHGRNNFSWKGVKICVEYFVAKGHTDITVFLPRYYMAHKQCPVSKEIIEYLEKNDFITFTPSRKIHGKTIVSYEDRFVVELATRKNGIIVSNDNFRDLLDVDPSWTKTIEERLLLFCFVGDMFMVPDDPYGRFGPRLEELLTYEP